MSTIRVLPPSIANRIAAGEVVERPASVVKELVENALDAGADAISVTIEAGGRALIRVTDDGVGMAREDLLLCLERHATSKLAEEGDLQGIVTLGFRGEALPAIAAVSLVRITTSTGESSAGWRLDASAGAVEGPEEAVAPERGTVVEVRSLFFNTPARRKFLRSEQRETSLISETMTQLALSHIGTTFSLVSDGKRLLSVPGAGSRRERVAALIGDGIGLLHAAGEVGAARVEAFLGGLEDSRPDRSGQRFIVNGRPVRDRTLLHAVSQAYGPVLPPGRFPIITLYVDIPPDAVDVNVHPAKSEVRFRRPGEIHRAVTTVLSDTLREAGAAPSIPWSGAAGRAVREPSPHGPATLPIDPSHAHRHPSLAEGYGAGARAGRGEAPRGPQGAVPLAQYRDSYIVATDGEGLLVVDQHAAHERVLFERLLHSRREAAPASQRLLIPATLDLPPGQAKILETAAEGLRKLGLEVEPFGEGVAVIRALPEPVAGIDPARLVREIVSDLEQGRLVVDDPPDPAEAAEPLDEPGPERFPGQDRMSAELRRTAASAACHAAIKINHPLTYEKMAWLLDELGRCRVPTTCPHGRPISLRMEHREIEQAFLRI